jgi:hypothetical protein
MKSSAKAANPQIKMGHRYKIYPAETGVSYQYFFDSNEQYAAAKMRLFRAFDQQENLSQHRLSLVVDETNVEELIEPLDLA